MSATARIPPPISSMIYAIGPVVSWPLLDLELAGQPATLVSDLHP